MFFLLKVLVSAFIIALAAVVILLLFIFAGRWGVPFWLAYGAACLWLIPAFYLHRFLFRLL